MLLLSWSPARSECRRHDSGDFRRRRSLFGSGSSLSSIPGYGYPQSDPGIAYPCFNWAGSTQAHTGQFGFLWGGSNTAQLASTQQSSCIGSTRPTYPQPTRPESLRPVQPSQFTLPVLDSVQAISTGSAHCSAVQLVSGLVQVKLGPVKFVAVRLRPVQYLSGRFSASQAGSVPVQVILTRFNPVSGRFSSLQA